MTGCVNRRDKHAVGSVSCPKSRGRLTDSRLFMAGLEFHRAETSRHMDTMFVMKAICLKKKEYHLLPTVLLPKVIMLVVIS